MSIGPRSLAGVAVAALLGLVACGGSKPSTSTSAGSISPGSHATSAAKNPCAMTSPSGVAAAFGGAVGEGKVDDSLPDPACTFTVTGSNLGIDGSVAVFLSPEQTASTFQTAKKTIPDVVAVSLGDEAFYNPRTSAIEFIKGPTVGTVQAIFTNFGGPPVDAAKVKADTLSLAQTVVAGL